jgi:hypothetical protein
LIACFIQVRTIKTPNSGADSVLNVYVFKEKFTDISVQDKFISFLIGLHVIDLYLLLLQSALQPSVGFRPAQLSLSILSRKVLQSAVASSTSDPQLGGEPVI